MQTAASLDERLDSFWDRISPAERRVARYFRDNREEVLIASAAALAGKIGTSDATVVRTAKALGFSGLEELRRSLAGQLREDLTPARRLARTLDETGDDLEAAFETTLASHQASIEALRRDIAPEVFRESVRALVAARRVFVFGLGPSSAMADYFSIQLARFGLDARGLTHSGLLLADGLRGLETGDLLMIFAYGRVYRELTVLLDRAEELGLATLLVSDSLGPKLRGRVDRVLPVARGRADRFSLHTATLALIEALLVGVAAARPRETVASLETLNRLRAALAGRSVGLPTP